MRGARKKGAAISWEVIRQGELAEHLPHQPPTPYRASDGVNVRVGVGPFSLLSLRVEKTTYLRLSSATFSYSCLPILRDNPLGHRAPTVCPVD